MQTMITKLSLQEIQEVVKKLARVINAPSDSLPTFGFSEQSGRSHIEVDSMGYHYIMAERGQEFERHTFADIDDLLYKIFASITFEISINYELVHRIENRDGRRIMFQHQVGLLSMISLQWGEREIQEHNQILARHPFDDFASIRATLCGNLREQGYSSEVAEKMAYEKYPLSKDS